MILIKKNSSKRRIIVISLVFVVLIICIVQFLLYNYTFILAFINVESITIIGEKGKKEIKDEKIIETFIDEISWKISMRKVNGYRHSKKQEIYYLDFHLSNSRSVLIAFDRKNKILVAPLSKRLSEQEFIIYDEFIKNNY